jgi:hypothetical protein
MVSPALQSQNAHASKLTPESGVLTGGSTGLGNYYASQQQLGTAPNSMLVLAGLGELEGFNVAELNTEERDRRLTLINSLLAEGNLTGEGVKRGAKGDDARQVQQALQLLGYLPDDVEGENPQADGQFGANSTSALLAFQANTSGVDEVSTGLNENGKPTYLNDASDPQLKGIVTGQMDERTQLLLIAQLQAQQQQLTEQGEVQAEPETNRQMGDTQAQRLAIAQRIRDLGKDPDKLMQVNTSAFAKEGLRPHVLEAAIDGWENAFIANDTDSFVIQVNDQELPAFMQRSFTIDLTNFAQGLIQQEIMSHGKGSSSGSSTENKQWSTKFGEMQVDGSRQSVLGGMVAGYAPYIGGKTHGTMVQGVETDINDEALSRLIRTHAPSYDTFGDGRSSIGRNHNYQSFGCMVYANKPAKAFRDLARAEGGAYIFNYYPHEAYFGNATNAVTGD